jgi:hypothetical protein
MAKIHENQKIASRIDYSLRERAEQRVQELQVTGLLSAGDGIIVTTASIILGT